MINNWTMIEQNGFEWFYLDLWVDENMTSLCDRAPFFIVLGDAREGGNDCENVGVNATESSIFPKTFYTIILSSMTCHHCLTLVWWPLCQTYFWSSLLQARRRQAVHLCMTTYARQIWSCRDVYYILGFDTFPSIRMLCVLHGKNRSFLHGSGIWCAITLHKYVIEQPPLF